MSNANRKKTPDVDYVTTELLQRLENGEELTREQVEEEYTLRSEGWREPDPLTIESCAPLPYPIEALPPMIREAILDLQRTVQAPLPLIAASVIASANLAVQTYVDIVTVDGRALPISLFFITEGLSGERKSTVDGFAMTAHHELDDEIRRKAFEQRDQLEADSVLWEGRREEFQKRQKKLRDPQSRMSIAEERAAFREQVGSKPPVWQGAPVRIVRDPTFEGLEKHFSISPSAGLFCDEAATFLGGYSMSEEKAFRTIAGLSSLWDGKGVNRARSADGMNSSPGKRLAMHLMVQPVIFNRFIAGNEGMKGQGFLARCLVTRAPSTMGTRKFVRENPLKSGGMVNFLKRVREILAQPIPLKEGGGWQLQPRPLVLSPAAEELYINFYDEIETRQGKDGDLADITGAASKMPEQALRLAATFQFFSDPTSCAISEESFRAGMACARYYLNEALRVDQDGGRDFRLECAGAILQFIKKHELRTFNLTRIRRYGPGSARKDGRTTRELLGILVSHGYLQTRCDAKTNHITYLAHPRLWSKAS